MSAASDRDTLLQTLIIKAWKDPSFRDKLTMPEEAKTVVEEHLGEKLPEAVRVQIHIEDDRTIHLVIPRLPDTEPIQDQELPKISGYVHMPTALTVVCSAC